MAFRDYEGAHRHAGIPVAGRIWRDELLQDDNIGGMIFQDCVFERVRLVRINLAGTIFLNARFDDCVFEDCNFQQTAFTNCTGERLCIRGGGLYAAILTQAELRQLEIEQTGNAVVLAESQIDSLAFDGPGRVQHDLTISGCKTGEVLAENVVWRGASAVQADLSVWTLANAKFTRCSFIRTQASGVDLGDVRFDSCNLYQSTFDGARLRWAERSIFAECGLAGADFAQAKLSGALFSKVAADDANFERAELASAMFPDADLKGARFAGASARNSVWLRANLAAADFASVDAWRGSFRNAVLKGADVANASFVEADLHGVEESLAGADLRQSRGSVDWRADRETESAEPDYGR